MWKAKFFLLLVVLMNLSSATTVAPKAATKGKTVAVKEQQKDPKEKRDTPSSAPYSYDVPHKQFYSPVHVNQQKHTSIEHLIPQNKVAPLEYLPKHEAPKQQYQEQHQQQHYHPTSFAAPMAPVENLFNDHPVKEIEDYSFGYPHYESFAQFPGLYYNGEYDKVIAVPLSALQGYKSPYSYQAPAASYSYPQQSYPMPNYAPSIPAHYSSSFTQSPGSLFIPQTVNIAPKPHGKVPDYAQGSKGLSHFSTVASLPPISSSYTKQPSYDVPSYSFTQTERPFKPSAFLGASMVHHEHHDSYVPTKSYLPPSSPPKELQYHKPQYVAAEPQYHHQQYAAKAPAIDYEIHYVQYPVGKSYLPQAPAQNAYLPTKSAPAEAPKSSYLPPAPSAAPPTKTYLPQAPIAKLEKPKSSYLPSTNTYLPPNNPFASAAHHYQTQPQQYSSSQQYSSQSQSHEAYDSQEYSQALLGHK